MENIKVGDIVTIGTICSPKMTVQKIFDNTAICLWFDKRHHLHDGEFDLLSLKKHIEDPKRQVKPINEITGKKSNYVEVV